MRPLTALEAGRRRERTHAPSVTRPTPLRNAYRVLAATQDELLRAKCRALIAGYDARWRNTPLVPVVVEQLVEAPLVNPATNAQSRTFRLAGKVDVIARDGEDVVLIDHKTTSSDLSADSMYWRQLAVESQATHYMLLEWLNGRKVDTAVWDVARKPTISPKKLSKADTAGITATGEYFGSPVTFPAAWDGRETPAMYEARLRHDCTVERPEWYFARHPMPRLDSELLSHAAELWDYSQEIIAARRNDRHSRNDAACMLYGSPCQYLGICSGFDSPDSDTWRRKESVHSELPELDGDGRDVLTYSRLRGFKTCRRKHQYRYELGIERQDTEDRDALVFGSVWHAAQEAYWRGLLPMEEYCNGSTTEAKP